MEFESFFWHAQLFAWYHKEMIIHIPSVTGSRQCEIFH